MHDFRYVTKKRGKTYKERTISNSLRGAGFSKR